MKGKKQGKEKKDEEARDDRKKEWRTYGESVGFDGSRR